MAKKLKAPRKTTTVKAPRKTKAKAPKRAKYVEREQFAPWDADREDMRPFFNLDEQAAKGPVDPGYPREMVEAAKARGREMKPWFIEDDCSVRSPWGEILGVDRAPPAVRAAAKRCQSGGPWRTVRDDVTVLHKDLTENLDYTGCTDRLVEMARYRYLSSALETATGKHFGRHWFAEKDFINRCVRRRPEKPRPDTAEREDLIEMDGPALDTRRNKVNRRDQEVTEINQQIFEQGDNPKYPGFPGGGRCIDLVYGVLDAASDSGEYEAERSGPGDPPNTYEGTAATASARTMSWCLRPNPRDYREADDVAERSAAMDFENPDVEARAVRARRHEEEHGRAEDEAVTRFAELEIDELPPEVAEERARRGGRHRPSVIVPPESRAIPVRSFEEELAIRRARGTRRGRADRTDETLPDPTIPDGIDGARTRSRRKPKRKRR